MFTIAIPIYKYKPEFESVLDSIKKLNKSLIEEIICCIQPTEDVSRIIDIIKKSKLPIKYYVNEKNIGMVENWNKCLDACQSKYLIINHDDDYLISTILDEYIDLFKKYPEVALISSKQIYSSNNIMKKNMKRILNFFPSKINYYDKGNIADYVLTDFTLPCSSVAFNMQILGNKYKFSNLYPYSADEELWPRVLKDYPIIVLKKYLILRNIGNEGNNYEYETWYKDDFVKQYIDIRRKIILYSHENHTLINYFKKKLISTFKRVEEYTNIPIDSNYYIYDYMMKKNEK